MSVLRAESVETPVVPAGFTLVEEDDVAFTLSLCREVHRIYGEYQEGTLSALAAHSAHSAHSAKQSLKDGLLVTIEMLAALSSMIDGGMPSMRIAVAATQTREMLAVVFDDDPLQKPVAGTLWGSRRPTVVPTSRPTLTAVDSAVDDLAEEPLPPHVLAALQAPEGPAPRRRGWRLFRRGSG